MSDSETADGNPDGQHAACAKPDRHNWRSVIFRSEGEEQKCKCYYKTLLQKGNEFS